MHRLFGRARDASASAPAAKSDIDKLSENISDAENERREIEVRLAQIDRRQGEIMQFAQEFRRIQPRDAATRTKYATFQREYKDLTARRERLEKRMKSIAQEISVLDDTAFNAKADERRLTAAMNMRAIAQRQAADKKAVGVGALEVFERQIEKNQEASDFDNLAAQDETLEDDPLGDALDALDADNLANDLSTLGLPSHLPVPAAAPAALDRAPLPPLSAPALPPGLSPPPAGPIDPFA